MASFPQVKFNAQSVGDFLNASLIANGIAGRRNHGRLPPVSMVFANSDINLTDAQRGDDHVGQLVSGSEFLGHWPSPSSLGVLLKHFGAFRGVKETAPA
jgi:hypothetical protein